MANIQFRAYASLTPAQLVPAVFERAYQIAILDLTARELHKTLSANDIDNLEQRLINPLRTHYANPANDTAHFHLPPNIFIETVTVNQWQLLRAAGKSGYPMFNVYDCKPTFARP